MDGVGSRRKMKENRKEGQEGWEGEGRGEGEEGRAGYKGCWGGGSLCKQCPGAQSGCCCSDQYKTFTSVGCCLYTSAKGQALNRRHGNPKDATTITALEKGNRLGWTESASATTLNRPSS